MNQTGGGLLGLNEHGRQQVVRFSYGALLDTCLWLIADYNSRSQLPTELLGDALLAIVRDWDSLPAAKVVMLTLHVEQRNAAILEADRQRLKGPTLARGPAPRPTRTGKRKARPKAGRR